MVDLDKLLRATTPNGPCACGHAKRSHSNNWLKLPCRFCACENFRIEASSDPATDTGQMFNGPEWFG